MSLISKPINAGKRTFFRIEKWLYYQGWLESINLPMPDFLCIGSQKAGTTWLYENLRCHQELFLPARKELNYFSSKYRFYGMPLGDYSNYFKTASGIKGEVTPCANLSVRRIRFIKTIMPSLKIILIIRNPIERMWASALMYLVQAQKRPFNSITDEEFYQLFDNPDLLSRGHYPDILKNWRSIFPEEQLHICFYDDLLNNPKSFLKSIFQFLEVSTDVDWSLFLVNNVFNKSPEYKCPEHLHAYLRYTYRKSISLLAVEFPEQTKGWL